jgi:hypothetical protein
MKGCGEWYVASRISVALLLVVSVVDHGFVSDFVGFARADDDEALVRATVVDETTNQPVDRVLVLPGVPYDGVRPNSIAVWQPHLIRESKGGEFVWSTRRSYREFRLRFEAKGYKPYVTPWLRKDGGTKSIEVRLQKDPGIFMRVLTPDGTPADGAVLAISMPNRTVRLKNGRIFLRDEPEADKPSAQWRRPPIFTADELGRCRLDTETSYAVLVVTHGSGFADLPMNDLEFDTPIRLRPWGSVDGVVRWHDQVGKQERLTMIVSRDYHYPDMLSSSADVTTDDEGRFRLEKLPPGRVQLSRVFEMPEGGTNYLFPYAHFDVKAGPPTKVIFGGAGTTVTGKLVSLDSWKGINVRITPNTPRPGDEQGIKAYGLIRQSHIGPIFFTKNQPVEPDGTFQLTGVLPGFYQLFISSDDRRVYTVRSFNVPHPANDTFQVDIGQLQIRRRGE